MTPLNIVIVSGLSGSGKSHALRAFEDAGYYCIDNLPAALIPTFVELCNQHAGEMTNVALGVDVRERVSLHDLIGTIERMKLLGHTIRLIFLEAREEVLVRRFSESRRPHPLLPQVPVLEGVRYENERMADLRRQADRILDTSDMTVHELREFLTREFMRGPSNRKLTVTLLTFGFKFGVPYDIDLLFDVRFLKNPFFIPDLKPLPGDDPRVRSFVLGDPDTIALIGRIEELLKFLIPMYQREQRSYLTIAIGCTGGRHRSVAIAGRLRESLADSGIDVLLKHRDLQKS